MAIQQHIYLYELLVRFDTAAAIGSVKGIHAVSLERYADGDMVISEKPKTPQDISMAQLAAALSTDDLNALLSACLVESTSRG